MQRILTLAWLALSAPVVAAQGPISIGIAPTLMDDLNPGQQRFVKGEFPLLVKDFTGLDGTLAIAKNIDELAARAKAGTDAFAVFQGIEFSWLTKKHAELVPLLVATYRTPRSEGLLVVKKDGPLSAVGDLKGKKLTWLRQGKEHVRLFVNQSAGGDPKGFFGPIVTPENAEVALDALLLNTADVAAVDQASLDIYQEVNPGRAARLKTLARSAPLPPTIVAYVKGKTPADVVERFRAGMLKANESERGRDVMSSFKITRFEPIPPTLGAWIAEGLKAYPNPVP